ncbi:MAG: hypothetical protein ACR2RV_09935 [Verrucomicrobiales bacterium]
MKPASASQPLALASAVCAVVLLGACKTTTTETWSRREIGTDWEKRTMGKATTAMEQINAAANGDDSAGYTANEFDMGKSIENKSSWFGKKYAEGKTFKTKKFEGADEYKSESYQFLKRQEFDRKTSADQDVTFADATTKSPDSRRGSIFQNERADTKGYKERRKKFETSGYRDTELENQRLENKDLNIVEDEARSDGAMMTVDDVRNLLHGSGT